MADMDHSGSGFNRGSTYAYPSPIHRPMEIRQRLWQTCRGVCNDESEPDDGKQKKKDWWATDVKVEFDKLKAENPDVIGWIRFDNQDELGINYPILYSGDNEKYLRTDLYGNSHIAGCIFLEGLNKSDFSDYYNIIYGHNMNDGSMFGSLKKYKDDGFWKRINTLLYILRQPPTVIESSLMKMRSMAVMCIK